jgi:hypothetical protein
MGRHIITKEMARNPKLVQVMESKGGEIQFEKIDSATRKLDHIPAYPIIVK